jgi:hypothetical protein
MARKYWIKALGYAANPLDDEWEGQYGLTTAVMFKSRPMVEKGDRIVYYASGTKLIFAEGEVTSHPYSDAKRIPDLPDFPWFVDVRLDIKKSHLRHGAPIGALSVGERSVSASMRRRSHIQLTEDEHAAAIKALTS